MDNFILSCVNSKIENNRNLYGCFQLGLFNAGQAITIANAMRRSLLSELTGFSIVCVEIEGVNHEYSNIKGVRESVLDILLNLKKIIFICNDLSTTLEIGFLKIQGPAVVRSCDLKLPISLKCVDPSQYIATLSNTSYLEIKFMVCKGKNFVIQTSFDVIAENFYSYFYTIRNNEKNISILKKQNIGYSSTNSVTNMLAKEKIYYEKNRKNFSVKKQKLIKKVANQKNKSSSLKKKKTTLKNPKIAFRKGTFNSTFFNKSLTKFIHNVEKNTIFIKSYQKEKNLPHLMKINQIYIWRKKHFLKNKLAIKYLYLQKKHMFKRNPIILSKKKMINLEKKLFHNLENIVLYSNLKISNFQILKNLVYKQNLKKKKTTGILLLDPVFMPIRKVNFSIQNIENFYKIKNKTLVTKFQKKTATEKIILEIWTNGSIDPKNAIYKATQKIIEIFMPFQKIYLPKKRVSA